MKALIAVLLVFFCFAVVKSETDCISKCEQKFNNNDERKSCQGACQFCDLQDFNSKKQECSDCESTCTLRYSDSKLTSACLKGCGYSKKAKGILSTVYDEVKSGAEWAWNKSRSFLNRFFKETPKSTDSAVVPKLVKPPCKKKSSAIQTPPEGEQDTVWITRLRILFIGNPAETNENVLTKQGPMIPEQIEFNPPFLGHDEQKMEMSSGDIDRLIMVRKWVQRTAALRPLLLIGAISSFGLAMLSLAALCLLIKNARRRRQNMVAGGNLIYTDLPKYEDDISREKAAQLAADEMTTTDDKAPLTV